MGKIKFKKPDIKGCFGKLKSLKWADMKNGIRAMKKRQAEKEPAALHRKCRSFIPI